MYSQECISANISALNDENKWNLKEKTKSAGGKNTNNNNSSYLVYVIIKSFLDF